MIAAAAVALFVIQCIGARNVVFEGMFAATEPDVVFPVETFVTLHPTELQFWPQNITSSYISVVLTGKFAPNGITVGAVPVTL